MNRLTFFIDILTLFDETYAGIANVNYQIAKYFLQHHGANTHFFYFDRVVKKEIVNSLIQKRSGREFRDSRESSEIYEDTVKEKLQAIKTIKTKTVGIFQHVKSLRNTFDYEVQMIYDLTALLTPEFHYEETLKWHVPAIEKDLESNSLCVCISHSTREDLVNYLGFPFKKTLVSHLGYDERLLDNPFYQKVLDGCKDKVEDFILILGTVEPRKNIQIVFEFLEKHPQILNEYKFIFIGRDAGRDGWGDTFHERISKLKIDERVKINRIKYFNYVSEEEKNILLMTARLMIYPSIYEGFGLPVLEALSVGCPVFASISSSIPEVAEDAACYFDPTSIKSFEDTFYRFLNDLKLNREMIVNRCIGQSAKFSWDAFIKRIISRIEEDTENSLEIKVKTDTTFHPIHRNLQILIIKLDHRGDFVLSIPAMMKLKERFRNAEIDIIVGEWNVSLAKNLNLFRQIHVYNFYSSRSFELPTEKTAEETALLNQLNPYDIAIDLRRPGDTRFLLAKIPAKLKVGYKTFSDLDQEIDVCLDTEMDVKGKMIGNNLVPVSLQLLKLVDSIPIHTVNLPKLAESKPSGKQIGIFPGAGVDSRQWPMEYYVNLTKEIVKRKWVDGINIYLSHFERDLAEPFSHIPNVRIFIGLVFEEMTQSLSTNRLVLANNSFAPHLCSYLGIPTIAIYSGVETVQEWQPPFGSVTIVYSKVPCLPCHDIAKNCPRDLVCLRKITPDFILKVIEKCLKEELHYIKTRDYLYVDDKIGLRKWKNFDEIILLQNNGKLSGTSKEDGILSTLPDGSESKLPRIRPLKELQASEKCFPSILEEISGHTLVSPDRCYVLFQLGEYANLKEGDVAEVGVYKGGTARLMAKVCLNKTVHLFDTFSGLPEENPNIDMHKKGDFSDISLESVQTFLKDCSNLVYHPGFFPDSAKGMKGQYCLVHIDVDLYQSVKDCLEYFYNKMVPGGVMVFDDYEWVACPGVKKALDEFLVDKPEAVAITTEYQCMVIKA